MLCVPACACPRAFLDKVPEILEKSSNKPQRKHEFYTQVVLAVAYCMCGRRNVLQSAAK
jgi:hypothetical protein